MGNGMTYHPHNQTVTVDWGDYDYEIDLEEINTPADLLDWVDHLLGKNWEGMTRDKLSAFIEFVAKKRGIKYHS